MAVNYGTTYQIKMVMTMMIIDNCLQGEKFF